MKSSCHFIHRLGMPTQFSDYISPVFALHGTNLYSLISSLYFHWSSLSVSWQRIYNIFTLDQSSNHTLSLHGPSSTTNLSWLLPAGNCLELWKNISYRLSLYTLRMDPTENTACIVEEACLPLGCLAIDVLLLSAIVCCGGILLARCLVMSYNIRYWDITSIVAHWNVLSEVLPRKALIKSVTLLYVIFRPFVPLFKWAIQVQQWDTEQNIAVSQNFYLLRISSFRIYRQLSTFFRNKILQIIRSVPILLGFLERSKVHSR
jgi:hypothetical protein